MKKLAFALCLLLFVLLLAACNNNSMLPPTSNVDNLNNIDISDLDALTTKYLNPLLFTSILSHNWNSADELPPRELNMVYLSEKITSDSDEDINWDIKSFPAAEVEALIQRYFDISTDHLRSTDEHRNYYNPETENYTFESVGAPSLLKVVNASIDNDIMTLNFEFYSRADDITVTREGELLLQIGTYGFKYMSYSTTTK